MPPAPAFIWNRAARAIIEDAFRAIEKNMLDAVPWPDVAPKVKYEPCRWQRSIRLINLIQKRLARPLRACGSIKVIHSLNKTWRRALQRTMAISSSRSSRKTSLSGPAVPLHPFYSSPASWASKFGFSSSSFNEWHFSRQGPKDVTMSNTCDPLLGYPQVAIRLGEWDRASIQERLNCLQPLRLRAQKAASYNLRMASADYLLYRKATLRRSELSKWARMIKPVTKAPFGFSAGWFTPPDGPPRRLLTAVEARKGAAQ